MLTTDEMCAVIEKAHKRLNELKSVAGEMLAALVKIESCIRPADNDAAAQAVRNAIAQARAAGIEPKGE